MLECWELDHDKPLSRSFPTSHAGRIKSLSALQILSMDPLLCPRCGQLLSMRTSHGAQSPVRKIIVSESCKNAQVTSRRPTRYSVGAPVDQDHLDARPKHTFSNPTSLAG